MTPCSVVYLPSMSTVLVLYKCDPSTVNDTAPVTAHDSENMQCIVHYSFDEGFYGRDYRDAWLSDMHREGVGPMPVQLLRNKGDKYESP